MTMRGKPYKALLALVALVCFLGVSLTQRELAKDRDALGLNRFTELKGAPPVLMLTTVALGGFRGLISNLLWIRASDLQDNDKFFEMVQLADWITKLEPHFTQVWTHEAWNMAYNISVKFRDPADRWRWVERGIQLLRDDGLRYNPDDVLIHRELAWFFQHKMGANLDDAQEYYKQMWGSAMSKIFETNHPNWNELIHPQTEDAKKRRADLLREKYKMDPQVMKEVNDHYGPLEWRLPEAHAIYWAYQGLEAAKRNPRMIDPKDLITLRRVIYQSMQLSFQRGRLVLFNPPKRPEFGPNLDIIPNTSAAYEEEMVNDPKNRDHIETAHRNFLRDAVWLLYMNDRIKDASKWYKYLGEKYPDKPLLLAQTNSFPRNVSLADYAMSRTEEEWSSPGQYNAQHHIEGMERMSYASLVIGDDGQSTGLDRLAQDLWERYEKKISVGGTEVSQEKQGIRIGLQDMKTIKLMVLLELLNSLPPESAAVLASKTRQKWPPEKPVTVARINGGKTAGVRARRTLLISYLSSNYIVESTDEAGSRDLSGLTDRKLMLNAQFGELCAFHQQRLSAQGEAARQIEPAKAFEIHRALALMRVARLEELGLARFVDANQTAWCYSVKGAFRICTTLLTSMGEANDQLDRSKLKRPGDA